ncbi:MAG: PEP-utilizing enzyme, partial [Bacilli bacterium]
KYHSTTKDISNMINKYIYDFGARVCDELKLETITMIEDEKLAYKIIKEALLNNIKMTVTNNEVKIPHNIKNISKKARKFIKNRERLRLKRTYVYSVVRNIFLAFGENYKKMGRINDERDVFFLSKEEVLTGVGDFKELVKQRKETYNNYSEDYLDRIAFYGEKVLPVYSSINKEGLIGTPSGNGVVKANVSLLNSPACYLKPGNIILTKRTDPGWISLFPSASGLIVEHGSVLSHSFIVARELGLPAIVGVKDATKKIKNNQLVTLDGLKGEITIED